MRILALDVGERRIGVAVSDEGGRVATPVDTVHRGERLADDLRTIAEIAQSRQVSQIVVGLPTSLSGQPGPAAQRMAEFASALREAVSVPVVLWDERFTTALAEKTLIAANVKRRQRRSHIDQMAAILILQSYLDARAHDQARQKIE